jgi:hypothetical protein
MADTKPSEWFFGVVCTQCHSPILLFHGAPESKLRFQGIGKLRVVCSNSKCQFQKEYRTEQILRFQATPKD